MRQIIHVLGFPKSGNTWLARLLGDIYNSPVQGLPGQESGSLAAEGEDRPGNFVIIQAHWEPKNYYNKFAQEEIDNRRTILIYRNPLDVAVSASYFWQISLKETVQHMAEGNWPFVKFPSWPMYYENNMSRPVFATTSYELLHSQPVEELRRLTGARHVKQAIYRQSFDVKRGEIKRDPQKYSYDLKTQLYNLRRGVVGDWRVHFDNDLLHYALDNFGVMMERLGYEPTERNGTHY